MVASSLQGVKGLGPSRRQQLIEHFGSLEALRGASREDLAALTWLPEPVAQNLYDHLQAPSEPKPTKGNVDDE